MSIDAKYADLLREVNAYSPRLMDWLELERQAAIVHLAKSRDVTNVHQAQGKYQFIEKMQNAMKGVK